VSATRRRVIDSTPPLSWQRLRAARRDVAARWPSPFRLRLEKRPSDVLYARLAERMSLLDVGAGDATRRDRVHARFPDVRYVSVDPDPESGADHADLGEQELAAAGEAFDVATLFEVVEHVAPEVALAMLVRVHELLAPGGLVIVSVPAIHTPGRFLRDCTHITPWAHDELGGLLVMAGFDVTTLVRTYPGSALARVARRTLLGPIGHAFGIGYAYSIVAVGARSIRDAARG